VESSVVNEYVGEGPVALATVAGAAGLAHAVVAAVTLTPTIEPASTAPVSMRLRRRRHRSAGTSDRMVNFIG